MKTTTSAIAVLGFVFTVPAAIASGPACPVGSSSAEPALCHLEIIEVPASELGPALDVGGFWVEDYIGGGMFDGMVSVGSCDGRCILESLPGGAGAGVHCVPTEYKPVRIENHSYAGVTPWRVWVPSACGCGTGPNFGWFTMLPDFDSADDLVWNVIGDEGTGGTALRAAVAGLPDLDGASSEALIHAVIELATPVFALVEAPELFRQANRGEIALTPALKAGVEQWVWSHTSDAITASFDRVSLSPASRATVIKRLRQAFPGLFAP